MSIGYFLGMNRNLLLFFIFIFTSNSFAHVYVKGYFKSNGTYVMPHYRTSPDHSLFNNWSTKGNFNPYTGKDGWIDPYKFKYHFNYFSNISNHTFSIPTGIPKVNSSVDSINVVPNVLNDFSLELLKFSKKDNDTLPEIPSINIISLLQNSKFLYFYDTSSSKEIDWTKVCPADDPFDALKQFSSQN